MKSPVIKRSIVIAGHKTSVSLEDAFWTSLKDIADDRNVTLSDLVSSIDTDRQHGNLSSAIRLFVLDHYRNPTPIVREPAVTRDLIGMRAATSVLRAEYRRRYGRLHRCWCNAFGTRRSTRLRCRRNRDRRRQSRDLNFS
jgi:predicted DNA-binding ribbon-helix-helix protein